MVKRRGRALVAVAAADRNLRDVDFGDAVALDQRGPGDCPLDRGAAVREAVDLTGGRDARSGVDDLAVCQEGAAQPRPERRRHDAPASLRRAGPPFAERERIRIVDEVHGMQRQAQFASERQTQVDAVQRFQLVSEPGDAVPVVEGPGYGEADGVDVAGHVPRRVDDPLEEHVAISLGRQRDPHRLVDAGVVEVDEAGTDVRSAEIESSDRAAHGTNAFTTLHSGPRVRRRRYRPTAAGTTIVSAYDSRCT